MSAFVTLVTCAGQFYTIVLTTVLLSMW